MNEGCKVGKELQIVAGDTEWIAREGNQCVVIEGLRGAECDKRYYVKEDGTVVYWVNSTPITGPKATMLRDIAERLLAMRVSYYRERLRKVIRAQKQKTTERYP